jgi:bacterioferritin
MSHQTIIISFNQLLGRELSAINQYFLHARILKKLGHTELADHAYKASIASMRNADMLIEFILAHESTPSMRTIGLTSIGDTRETILQNDISFIQETLMYIGTAINICVEASAVEMLRAITVSTEAHLALLEEALLGKKYEAKATA